MKTLVYLKNEKISSINRCLYLPRISQVCVTQFCFDKDWQIFRVSNMRTVLANLASKFKSRYHLFQKSPISTIFFSYILFLLNIAWPWWWTLKKSELSVWKAWLIPSLWQWHWPIYRLLLSFKERWKNVKAKCLSSIQGNIIKMGITLTKVIEYRTRATITRSWSETALEY